MSKIFEIVQRDAAARIGKLILENTISTPAIIRVQGNDILTDSGSMWQKAKIPEQKKIIIAPHKSIPLHVRGEIIKEIQSSVDSQASIALLKSESNHAALVVHPRFQELLESDMYVLGAARQLENNSREFVNDIIKLKENTRADSLLYAPALALPENLSLLVYMGVDIVDETLAEIKGYQDFYLTNSGEFHLSRLHEFPCTCSVCSGNKPQELAELPKKERAEALSKHNTLKLGEEMRTIREHIRTGHLREYLERQCRAHPWLTASLRLIDAQFDFLEKRTPVIRSNTLYANTSESLNRIEVKRFAARVMERYKAPDLDTLVLLPCSAKKPYSMSLSHQKFQNAMGKYRKYVHEVIITSPMGVVPRELELIYPSAHYDTPVTGHWDLEEKAWVSGCLKNYIIKNKYKNIIAHVDGAYREICESIGKELGIDIRYTADGSVTSGLSLDNLAKAVSQIGTVKRRSSGEAKLDIIRSTLDYQFGKGAGGMLVSKEATLRASFPKFQLFDGKQLGTLIPQFGTFALTVEGGMRLKDYPYYRVEIGDFIPHSSILAPGVIDADPQIRPNDEVIVKGGQVFGVGRALMGGWEMKECSKGVAVELRHVKRIE